MLSGSSMLGNETARRISTVTSNGKNVYHIAWQTFFNRRHESSTSTKKDFTIGFERFSCLILAGHLREKQKMGMG